MEFSFATYRGLLEALRRDFRFSFFTDYAATGRVFLRHDIDLLPEIAREIARVEEGLGARSTFFFQPDSDFYNLLAREVRETVEQLAAAGHAIGLHVDLRADGSAAEAAERVRSCHAFYSRHLPLERVVSFHRPVLSLVRQVTVDGFVNVYAAETFGRIRYFSDSRRNSFAEALERSLAADGETSLQLLTHPYWWDRVSLDLWQARDRLVRLREAALERALARNVEPYRDLQEARGDG